MTKRIAFTICARNYYGLAQVLRQSVQRQNPDIEFLVFIADGIPTAERGDFGDDAIDAVVATQAYVAADKLREMAFKYNLTEYCTAIKPFCFQHVFDRTDAQEAAYLDPDIFVFSPLEPVFEPLRRASVVLTPHIVFPSLHEGKRPDKGLLATGVFNLGFLALKRGDTSTTLLAWWGQRLLDQCFVDSHDALFTDQKWMDFVPTLFPNDEVVSLRHGGMNMAPWNFHERAIATDSEGRFLVSRRPSDSGAPDLPAEPRPADPLVFVHFSGFDYKKFCEGQVAQYNIDGLNLYPDLSPLIEHYMQAIQALRPTVLQFLGKAYAYGSFADGSPVLAFHRRLYRSAVESGMTIGDPFSAQPGSFLQTLRDRALVMPAGTGNVEKSNKFNLSGVDRKLVFFNRLMRLTKRLIGFKNYLLLLRLMRPYSRVESQLHLIDPRQNKL